MKNENPIRPVHYYPGDTYEPINIIEAWGLDFHLGNAIKYIARAGKKGENKEAEDLKKAAWYIERHIEYQERQKNNLKVSLYVIPDQPEGSKLSDLDLQGLHKKLYQALNSDEATAVFLPGEITSLKHLLQKVTGIIEDH